MKIEINDKLLKKHIEQIIHEMITTEELKKLVQFRLEQILTEEVDSIIRYKIREKAK